MPSYEKTTAIIISFVVATAGFIVFSANAPKIPFTDQSIIIHEVVTDKTLYSVGDVINADFIYYNPSTTPQSTEKPQVITYSGHFEGDLTSNSILIQSNATKSTISIPPKGTLLVYSATFSAAKTGTFVIKFNDAKKIVSVS